MTPIISFEEVLKDIYIKPSELAKDLAKIYGYRAYMVERYIKILGLEDAKELLEAMERSLKPSIRCNTLRVKNCNELIKSLSEKGYELEKLKWYNEGFRVLKIGKPKLGATREYLLGHYYLYRGVASQLPPLIMEPKENSCVLDMCAAPGGKLTHIAQLMRNTGLIIGMDISRKKMRALRSHVNRLGVINTILIRANALKAIKDLGFENSFDYVLLDAPCSGEGLIQIDRSRKTKTSIEDLARIITKQITLLLNAFIATKPGGVIVYSTCSIAPEENEYVVTKAIELFEGEVSIVKVDQKFYEMFSEGLTEYNRLRFLDDLRYAIRLYPHKHDTEGFFICKMVRKS